MASVKGLQTRFDRALAEESFYDAEQACRQIYYRLLKAKQPDEARDAILRGATALLAKGQVNSGTALGLILVKHMSEASTKEPYGPEPLDRLSQLAMSFPSLDGLAVGQANESARARLEFVRSAIAWSKTSGGPINGNEKMNAVAGELCVRLKDYPAAQKLFLCSDEPLMHAEMVMEWAETSGLPSEWDLFMLRTLFKYLVTGNLKDATVVREAFEGKFGKGTTPLANFAEMLIKTLERANAYPLFCKLRDVYGPSLARDSAFDKYMVQVAQTFYNVQPPQPGGLLGSMMGNMMRSMGTMT